MDSSTAGIRVRCMFFRQNKRTKVINYLSSFFTLVLFVCLLNYAGFSSNRWWEYGRAKIHFRTSWNFTARRQREIIGFAMKCTVIFNCFEISEGEPQMSWNILKFCSKSETGWKWVLTYSDFSKIFSLYRSLRKNGEPVSYRYPLTNFHCIIMVHNFVAFVSTLFHRKSGI